MRVQQGDVWQPVVIIKRHEQPRSFIIQSPDGRTYRRNRKHLLKTREKSFTTATDNTVSDTNSVMDSHVTDAKLFTMVHETQNTDLPLSQSHGYITRSGRQVNMHLRYKD